MFLSVISIISVFVHFLYLFLHFLFIRLLIKSDKNTRTFTTNVILIYSDSMLLLQPS
jgi:hypothetical protein